MPHYVSNPDEPEIFQVQKPVTDIMPKTFGDNLGDDLMWFITGRILWHAGGPKTEKGTLMDPRKKDLW